MSSSRMRTIAGFFRTGGKTVGVFVFSISKRYGISVLLLTALSLVAGGSFFISSGTAGPTDLPSTYTLEAYLRTMVPLWSWHTSEPTLQNLPYLIYTAPLLLIHIVLELPTGWFLSSLVFFSLFSAAFAMYAAMILISRCHYGQETTSRVQWAALVAAVLFILNPWALGERHHQALFLGYALSPLLFVSFWIALQTRRWRWCAFAGILLAIAGTTPHFLAFGSGLLFLGWLAFIVQNRTLRAFGRSVKIALTTIGLWALFSAYWLLPLLYVSTFRSLQPDYIITAEVIDLLSRNSSLLDVLRLTDRWFTPIPFEPSQGGLNILWQGVSFGVPALALLGFWRNRRNALAWVFAAVAVISIILATGSYYVNIYFHLVGLPFGWVFRAANRWSGLLALSYSFLLGMLILSYVPPKNVDLPSSRLRTPILSPRRKIVQSGYLVGLLVLTLALASYSPAIYGYLNSRVYQFDDPPQGYDDIRQILESEDRTGKALYIPFEKTKPTYYLWYPRSDPGESIRWLGYRTGSVFTRYFADFAHRTLMEVDPNVGVELFSLMGVSYIVVTDVPPDSSVGGTNIISRLNEATSANLISAVGAFVVFRIASSLPRVWLTENPSLSTIGLSVLRTLSQISETPLTSLPIVFADQPGLPRTLFVEPTPVIYARDPRLDLAVGILESGVSLPLFSSTFTHNPDQAWSRAGMMDPLHGPFHSYLRREGFDVWSFDRDQGLVFTSATRVFLKAASADEGVPLAKYQFADSIQGWQVLDPNAISIAHLVGEGGGVLTAQVTNESESLWVAVESPPLSLDDVGGLGLSLRLTETGTEPLHVRMAFFDETHKEIAVEIINNGAIPADRFATLTGTALVPPKANYVRVQILARPVVGSSWIADDVQVTDLSQWVGPNGIETKVNLGRSGPQVLLLRTLLSPAGGILSVAVEGGKAIEIPTRCSCVTFTWIPVGTFEPDGGTIVVALENREGLNAIASGIWVPALDYNEALRRAESRLEESLPLVLLEAETDFTRMQDVTKIYSGRNRSGGESVVIDGTGFLSTTVSLYRPGLYTLALRVASSTGLLNLSVELDNQTFRIQKESTADLEWIHLGPIQLNPGDYQLMIRPPSIESSLLHLSNFEADTLEGWRSTTGGFEVSLDREASWAGAQSLKVIQDTAEEDRWSWIRSDPRPVRRGEQYLIVTHMRTSNTNSSHIVLEGQEMEGKWIQLAHVPPGVKGDNPWTEYRANLTVPPDIQAVRVALNAGWSLNMTRGPAITWFDEIVIVRGEVKNAVDLVALFPAEFKSPTDLPFSGDIVSTGPPSLVDSRPERLHVVMSEVPSSRFVTVLSESYDQGWRLRAVGAQPIPSFPLYGVVNGFLVEGGSGSSLLLLYEPQVWYDVGLLVTLIASVAVLAAFVPPVRTFATRVSRCISGQKEDREHDPAQGVDNPNRRAP